MAQDSKSRKLDQYIVRFPEGMRDKIKADAEASNRSLNAEIIARLEAYDVFAQRLEDAEQKLFTALNEREHFRKQWEQMAQIVDKSIDISKEAMVLEAERKRNEAQKAALEETKEHVERQTHHLIELHERNASQLAQLEKIRVDIQAMSKERLSIDTARDEIISQQAKLIEQLQSITRDGTRIIRTIMKAVDDAARGDTTALDKMVESARDEYHYDEITNVDDKD